MVGCWFHLGRWLAAVAPMVDPGKKYSGRWPSPGAFKALEALKVPKMRAMLAEACPGDSKVGNNRQYSSEVTVPKSVC